VIGCHSDLAKCGAYVCTSAWRVRRESAYAQTNAVVCRDIAISKDADPDIPILQQAKAEYAKLHL